MFNADYAYCFLHFRLGLLNSGHGATMSEWRVQCYQWRNAKHSGRPKFRHINMPLCLMEPLWWASFHKLPMAVGKKSAMPFLHGHHLTTLGMFI